MAGSKIVGILNDAQVEQLEAIDGFVKVRACLREGSNEAVPSPPFVPRLDALPLVSVSTLPFTWF